MENIFIPTSQVYRGNSISSIYLGFTNTVTGKIMSSWNKTWHKCHILFFPLQLKIWCMYNVYVFKCQLMPLTLSSYESFLSSNSSLYIQICSPKTMFSFPISPLLRIYLHYISQLYIFLHFLSNILTYFLKIINPFLFLFFYEF